MFSFSVIYNSASLFEQPVDFKTLSQSWVPEIQNSDLIFVPRTYGVTPIFVYLQGDGYHFVANDYAQQLETHPSSRVWVLSTEGFPISPPMQSALVGFRSEETLKARRVQAALYTRDTTALESATSPR